MLSEIAIKKLADINKEKSAKQSLLEEKRQKDFDDKEVENEKKKIILKQKHLEMLKSVAGHNLAIIKEKARDKLEKQQVEKKLTEANSAIDKMNENNFLIAQRKRREDAIKNINENFSLVQENEKIAEQKKQAETEEAFKALKNERLKKERLQRYIMAELPKIDKKHHPAILMTSLGGRGFFLDGEEYTQYPYKMEKPLLSYSTAQTRQIKLKQELDSLDSKPAGMENIYLPKLQGPTTRQKEFVGEIVTQFKPVPPNRHQIPLPNITPLPPIEKSTKKVPEVPPPLYKNINQLKTTVLPPIKKR